MDSVSDCRISGYLLIPTDNVVNVFSRRPGSSTSDVLLCTMRFKPQDERAVMDVTFTDFIMSDSDVTLRVDLTGGGVSWWTFYYIFTEHISFSVHSWQTLMFQGKWISVMGWVGDNIYSDVTLQVDHYGGGVCWFLFHPLASSPPPVSLPYFNYFFFII